MSDPRDGIFIASADGQNDRLIMPDGGLIADLKAAEHANMHARDCQVCQALAKMSESAAAGVERALAGTIGAETLANVLTRNGYPTGRRAVRRHRSEGHS